MAIKRCPKCQGIFPPEMMKKSGICKACAGVYSLSSGISKYYIWIVIFFVSVVLMATIFSFLEKEGPSIGDGEIMELVKEDSTDHKTVVEEKIAPDAIWPMDKKNFPRIYKNFGEKRVEEINSKLLEVAKKIAESPMCDKVTEVFLSEARSTPPNEAVFFADCQNGERFYVSEKDIFSVKTLKSRKELTDEISDSLAIKQCEDKVKQVLTVPLSFRRTSFSTSVYRAVTGNVEITFNFEAKNRIGNTLPQKARCIIDDRGIGPAELSF